MLDSNPVAQFLQAVDAEWVKGEVRCRCPVCQDEYTEPEDYKVNLNRGDKWPIVARCFNCLPYRDPAVHKRWSAAFFNQPGVPKLYSGSVQSFKEWWREAVGQFDKENLPTARIETLDTAYNSLIDQLVLREEHAKWLTKQGLDGEWARELGYRSTPESIPNLNSLFVLTPSDLPTEDKKYNGVPGLDYDGYWHLRKQAIITPCRNHKGQVFAIKQRILDGGNNRHRLLSSRCWGGPTAIAATHCPLGTGSYRRDAIWITEGERKADVHWIATGKPTIAVPGIGTCTKALEVIKELLEEGGKVIVALDQDGKKATERAANNLIETLLRQGYKTSKAHWRGKSKGLDDAILNREEIFEIEQRLSDPPPTPTQNKALPKPSLLDYVSEKGEVLRSSLSYAGYEINKAIREGKLKIVKKTKEGQILARG